MAGANIYALSLRGDGRNQEKAHETGVPFFVPQLAKVKTNIVCQTNSKHLLFTYEKAGGGSDFNGPTSPTTSYRKQGNQNFYTEENLRKRQKLVEDRRVIAGIARFWDTFPNIRQGQTMIEQRDYVDVFMKLYKALVAPHEFSIGEARKIVERDWVRDVGGVEVMSKALFFRSLFEVVRVSRCLTVYLSVYNLAALPFADTVLAHWLHQADIWTIGISVEEYVSFLKKLFDRVTMTIFDHERSLWVTVFAELDKIRSFAEPMEPKDVASAAMLLLANQEDQDTPAATAAQKSNTQGAGPVPSTSSKQRPPLLKKRSLVGNGPPSPQKLSAEPTIGGGGGSLRRLPEIPPIVPADPAMSEQQQLARLTAKSQGESFTDRQNRTGDASDNNGPSTSRSDIALRSPTAKALAASTEISDGNNSESAPSSNSSAPPSGPSFTNRPNRVQKSGSLRGDLNGPPQSVRKSATEDANKESVGNPSSRSALPELPPQPVRLAMPSIYLSPDLTQTHATERAARRRIRESAKLAHRLRRITF